MSVSQILSTNIPIYIYNLVPLRKYSIRHPKIFNRSYAELISSKKTSTPSLMNYTEIRDSSPEGLFPDALLKFVRPAAFKICSISDPMD